MTLSHLIYHLAHNQEKQQKLYQELKAEMTAEEPIPQEVLEDGLSYLKATVKESQRLDSFSSPVRAIVKLCINNQNENVNHTINLVILGNTFQCSKLEIIFINYIRLVKFSVMSSSSKN